ncbi:MAG: Riboflavin biosynthesis protein [Actinomycetota bacterium]|nr:Riboflavin biosynthesis protein [Actinomycetota bacterium]
MKRWYGIDDVDLSGERCVVAIGVYDGVHRGHRTLIRRAVEDAAAAGQLCVVVTFDPNPAEIVRPSDPPTRLSVLAQRLELIEECGAGATLILPFDLEMSKESPRQFVSEVLQESLRASAVVVGENFRFGYRASGDVAALREFGQSSDLTVDAVPLLRQELVGRADLPISSSEIRQLVADGQVAAAARALARPHRVEGPVVPGDRRGRELGFPTANVNPTRLAAIPADGVYAGRLVDSPYGDESRTMPAAISVGNNPTFDGAERRVEAFVVGAADLDLYDHYVGVEFVDRIRDQQTFASADSLATQMHKDIERTKHVLGLAE